MGKHRASQEGEGGSSHCMGPPTGSVAPVHWIATDRQHLGYRSLKSYCSQLRVRTILGKREKGRIEQGGGHGKDVPSFLLLFQGSEGKARELAISAHWRWHTVKPFFLQIKAENEASSWKFGFFKKWPWTELIVPPLWLTCGFVLQNDSQVWFQDAYLMWVREYLICNSFFNLCEKYLNGLKILTS